MIEYIFLGIVQGLTEFLPVSSSGHLVILQKLLGINSGQITVSVVLHLGTLLAVIIFFRRDILKILKDPRSLGLILLATAITGAIGFSSRDFFESLFYSVKAVGIAWLFTGLLLISTKRINRLDRRQLKLPDAIILGLAQALAIIPGISRSAITISALFYRHIEKRLAFAFSFLISVPVILGAAFLEIRKSGVTADVKTENLIAGFISSFLTGILALLFLRLVIDRAKFHYFGYYCLLMAMGALIL
ncbi:MAG: undecaprenyl-diphosphate phosphatase [Candidatus Omnitrophica bacterium]|nr:undecaprenyl-diphosphate phosphatase [Candidatus Omnitrophota bacterium]MDD5771393.1 undecaprenyl-diphosphate phosphatase [Candidatus Omnitrophota bacterium]